MAEPWTRRIKMRWHSIQPAGFSKQKRIQLGELFSVEVSLDTRRTEVDPVKHVIHTTDLTTEDKKAATTVLAGDTSVEGVSGTTCS